ncbi:hypothetical protein ACFL2I_00345 [Candidatus Omnitrophota bacterium]
MKAKTYLLLIAYSLQLVALSGCEAFRKKFVRESKKKKEIRAVTQTIDYASDLTTEQTYKNYYLFWSSWHEELIVLVNDQNSNRKKQLYAARMIVENLTQMRKLLVPAKQEQLGVFIAEQEDIIKKLDKFQISHLEMLRIKSSLARQKKQIQKEFDYRSIQENLAQ